MQTEETQQVNPAGLGHLLPGTRDWQEARDAITRLGNGQKFFIYHSYEQVLQTNILISFDPVEDTDEQVRDWINQAVAMSAMLDDPEATTVVGTYLVYERWG